MTPLTSGLHEECGVFGVYSQRQEDVASLAYYGLYSLQHRGQEGCGIVVNDDGVFDGHKGPVWRSLFNRSLPSA